MLAMLAALSLSACNTTDVVAYRALSACTDPSCMPIDSGADSGVDAGPPPDAGTCAAATCPSPITCAAPIARAIVGDSCGDQPWVAPGFRHALCSCDDYVSQFPLTVERDPQSAEQGAASVAVDDDFTAGARVEIAGSLYVAGMLALVDQASLDADDVQQDTATPRCDCGADVALSADAVLALAPSNPPGFDAARFTEVQTDVVLVVEGDIAIDANLEATLAEGALLELFVIGNVRVAGAMLLGDQDDDVRVYALGSGTIDLSAETFIAGPLYAPHAELVTRGTLTTMGSIFVRRAAPGGEVLIRYDSASSHASSCDAP
jgi:cytochrome c556